MYLDIQRRPGDTTIENDLVYRFRHAFQEEQWPGGKRLPEVYYDPRGTTLDRSKAASLHSKCIVIDNKEVFVSSANFTETAQQRNIEIGLVLSSDTVALRITSFFDHLVKSSQLRRVL